MSPGKLTRVVFTNALRNRSHFVLSAFGIVVGTAALVFFLSLSSGVEKWILGDWFPIDRVEVIAPRASLLGVSMKKKIDDATVEKIESYPGVETAVPRMAIAFPSMGRGWFEENELRFELVGDGIHPRFTDESIRDQFKDWEAIEDPEELESCGPAPKYRCEGLRFCDRRDMKCHHRVPVIVSRNLIEIYNSQFAESRGMPVIGTLEEFIAERGGLRKMRLYMHLGSTMVSVANKALKQKPRMVEGVILGVSDDAIPIGVTVPIQYVRRWNQEFLGKEAASVYSSVVVTLEDPDDVAKFGAFVMEELDLRLEDSVGEQLSGVILIVTLLFVFIALVIVTISAINIAHNFFMQVSERRREIGVLRAIGATKRDVRNIILGEAALIGLFAGIVGVAVAVGASLVADPILGQRKLPFQPESFFDFQWWILGGGLLFAVLFCILGGYLPARLAARLQPAQALVQQ